MEGGSCNDYDYACGDPVNQTDLSGTNIGKFGSNLTWLCVFHGKRCGTSWRAAQTAGSTADRLRTENNWTKGQRNAFRHAYWMALISNRYGSGWAISFGEAYEADNTGDGPDEANVDRHNNDFGAYLGRERKDATKQQLASELEAMVNDRDDQLDYTGCC